MLKFYSSVIKESRILLRDKAGLGILFLMPMVLIVIMSLLQEVGYSSVTRDNKVDVLFTDLDQDTLGVRIARGLRQSGFFNLIDSTEGTRLTPDEIRNLVRDGKYTIGVVIPEGVTEKIRSRVKLMVAKTLAGFGFTGMDFLKTLPMAGPDTVTIFFDPAVKKSFKNSILSAIRQYNYQIESELVFQTFTVEMGKSFPNFRPPDLTYRNAVEFKEVFPSYQEQEIIPDTAQHNVPAWAVFAMFFIIIPLTSNMIVEREEGSMIRLMSMPISYVQILLAKVFVYMNVCFVQTVLMILTGMFILPLFGASALDPGHQYPAIIMMTLFSALAALGFGVMTGTIATTHQQAAAFGAVAIIIMAAIGGLWVPMYLMAPAMKEVATLSPLNWALNGYYDIFLRGGGMPEVLSELVRLAVFFIITVTVTAIYRKIKNPMNR